jgi:hypothetical protein
MSVSIARGAACGKGAGVMTIQTILLHPGILCAGLFLALWAALDLGRFLARRNEAGGNFISGSAIDAAVFALLGLLVAFTFSGAAARFDHRRELIVQEANAIGTAYLRIDTLPAEAQPALREGFRAYIESRKAAYAVVADEAAFRAALERSGQLQRKLWQLAIEAGQRPGALPDAHKLLLPALNEMIDITTSRAMANEMHPPAAIYVMLFALVIVASVLAGFGMGGQKPRSWIHMFAFAATMAITITVIIDMEYPRIGVITVDAFERDTLDLSKPQ